MGGGWPQSWAHTRRAIKLHYTKHLRNERDLLVIKVQSQTLGLRGLKRKYKPGEGRWMTTELGSYQKGHQTSPHKAPQKWERLTCDKGAEPDIRSERLEEVVQPRWGEVNGHRAGLIPEGPAEVHHLVPVGADGHPSHCHVHLLKWWVIYLDDCLYHRGKRRGEAGCTFPTCIFLKTKTKQTKFFSL